MNILMDKFDPAGLQTIQGRRGIMGWCVVAGLIKMELVKLCQNSP